MKTTINLLSISFLLIGALVSGCAYTVAHKRGTDFDLYRIAFAWKTDGEIIMATNGTTTIKGGSASDSDALKAVVSAAVDSAVKAAK